MSDERVTLVRELSRSGVATVWEGWDNSLNRKVLVKSIHPQFARDADLRIRFEREARAVARLSHPNVVQIYDIQFGYDSLTLLLEFIEGETLGHLLKRRGVLPYDLALKITIEILSGLEQAHANGIIHRDLKPENILLSHAGAVKITDFGLASLRDLPAVTQDGMVVGTPSYMSPEQALGGETGPQTDLFTCGAMFFEMLTGQRLIQGESLGEAFQNVMKYRSPDLNVFQAAIPLKARKVLDELLERDPSQRLESAAVARNALLSESTEKLADALAIAAFMKGEERVSPIEYSYRRKRRRALWYGVGGTSVLFALLIFMFSELKWPDPKPQVVVPSRVDTTVVTNIDTAKTNPAVAPPPQKRDTIPIDRTVRTIDTTNSAPKRPQEIIRSGPAYVTLNSKPWARVFYNDSLLGTTPLMAPLQLPSGKGTLLFLNDQISMPISKQIDILAGDTTSININLQESVARVRVTSVKPWADVYVDGEMKFRTPSSQVLFLTLGNHKLELRHPDLPTYTKELNFKAGDPIYEVRIDLTKP